MLRFVTLGRDMPPKRVAEARAHDFLEIYGDFAVPKAQEQASRCSQCGVPYCQVHCPVHTTSPTGCA
jgi:glutamate synthase (NADPH/NADH) small chain